MTTHPPALGVSSNSGRAHRTTRRTALALFLLLFGVYVLTASGHTYSPDEESIFHVTRSLVERGDFNIPSRSDYPVVGGQRGVGGKIYSGTGILPSLALTPFYVAGTLAAQMFEARLSEYLVRLAVVSTFNALLAALAGAIFYGWMRAIGYTRRVAAALVLICALATMSWVYARTLYSETLLMLLSLAACFAVRAYHNAAAPPQRPGYGWMLLAGLAAGLAVLTKLQGALILPALALYFLALRIPPLRRAGVEARSVVCELVVPGALFLAPFVLCLALFGYYNFIRFGTAFETGYGSTTAEYPLERGLYGLLLSSGKSVFLYAPPILLGVFALPRALRRFTAEALLCLALVATVVVFHARLSFWSGDGAWGPRYLAATMPFWILPIGAALAAWWRNLFQRAAVLALVGAGVLVNLLGMSINFDTYIQIEPRNNVRYYEPAASPLLAQWNLLYERVQGWRDALGPAEGLVFLRGLTNTRGEEVLPQYLPPRAEVWVKHAGDMPAFLRVYALDYRDDSKPKRRLSFWANGAELNAERLPHADPGELEYNVPLPAGSRVRVEIITTGSAPRGKSPQGDELGVHLQQIQVWSEGRLLPLSTALAVPPAPLVQPRELWAWFFLPAHPHFDHFLWYLVVSGAPEAVQWSWGLALAVPAILCIIAGALLLRRALLPP